MKPDALKVALDILRELGREEEARWIEHPDAVRALLVDGPTDRNGECSGVTIEATSCGGDPYRAHDRDCPIAAAWRTLGDPRGQLDIENAYEEALAMQRLAPERCDAWNASGPFDYSATRCLKPPKHAGAHEFPDRAPEMIGFFKHVYSP